MDDDRNDVDVEYRLRIRFAAEAAAYFIHVAQIAVGTYGELFKAGFSGKQNESHQKVSPEFAAILQSHYDKCTQVFSDVACVFESVSLSYHACHTVIANKMADAIKKLPLPSTSDLFLSRIEDIKSSLHDLRAYVDWHKNGKSNLPHQLKEYETDALQVGAGEMVSIDRVRAEVGELSVAGAMILTGCGDSTVRRWLDDKDQPVKKTKSDSPFRYCMDSFLAKIDSNIGLAQVNGVSNAGENSVKTKIKKAKVGLVSEIKKTDFEKSGIFFRRISTK